MAEVGTMGPIDYLIVEFPGSKMTGKGFPLLVDLVERGITQARLELGADRPQHQEARRRREPLGRVKQRGLPRSRLAGDQEALAVRAHPVQEIGQPGEFPAPPDQEGVAFPSRIRLPSWIRQFRLLCYPPEHG